MKSVLRGRLSHLVPIIESQAFAGKGEANKGVLVKGVEPESFKLVTDLDLGPLTNRSSSDVSLRGSKRQSGRFHHFDLRERQYARSRRGHFKKVPSEQNYRARYL